MKEGHLQALGFYPEASSFVRIVVLGFYRRMIYILYIVFICIKRISSRSPNDTEIFKIPCLKKKEEADNVCVCVGDFI